MYAFCQDMPGVTLEEHEALANMIDPSAFQECIAHVAGPIDGGTRMVDVWASQEAYRRFQKEHLFPALDRIAEQSPAAATGSEAPAFTLLDVTGNGLPVGAQA